MESAVLHGTVDFSTTILLLLATLAMVRVADSMKPRFAAAPLPTPVTFVGVLTHTKIKSASAMADSMSVEKKRFGFARRFTALDFAPRKVFDALGTDVGVCASFGGDTVSCDSDNIKETRFIDRQIIRQPCFDTILADVNDSDLGVGLVSSNSRGGACQQDKLLTWRWKTTLPML